MNRRPDPLDASERALADLRARESLPGPSPQLDARILAAARASTSTPTHAWRRPRPRWIAGMSIAATLVLAVGIAWRLRPLPPQRPVASEAPAAARVVEPSASVASAPADTAGALQAPPAAKPVPMAPPLPPPASPERVRQAAREKAAPQPPVVFDAPAPMDTQAPPPAPPPPPAPVAAPNPHANATVAPTAEAMQAPQAQKRTEASDEAKNLDRIEVTGGRIKAASPPPPPQPFSRDATMDAAAAADAAAAEGVSRAMLDEEPPATADSPQVQEAWLQRIRDLLAAGQAEAARNSLAEFRRRYPKYALPEDLRALAGP